MKTKDMFIIGGILIAIGGAYYLLKNFKFPDLGKGVETLLVNLGATPETVKETGVPGAVGEVLYETTTPGGRTLREEATKPGGEYYERAEAEIEKLPGIAEATPEQIVPRAVAMGVSEEMHEEGFVTSMLKAPWTIGAGLGAITQMRRYYQRLPEEARKQAVIQEYETRQQWMQEHPIETMIGFPAAIVHAVTTPIPQEDFFTTMRRGWERIFG